MQYVFTCIIELALAHLLALTYSLIMGIDEL